MKLLKKLLIVILSGILMYQRGCFDDVEFFYGTNIIKILHGEDV